MEDLVVLNSFCLAIFRQKCKILKHYVKLHLHLLGIKKKLFLNISYIEYIKYNILYR